MIKNIIKGNTLLIRGPARLTLTQGKIDVFGKTFIPEIGKKSDEISDIDEENVIIIPSAQCYPIFALEESKLEVYTNIEDNLEIIEENSISQKWIEIKEAILKDLKEGSHSPLKIMVIGISSGKTT